MKTMHRVILSVAIAILAADGLVYCAAKLGLRWNGSASLPRGFYVTAPESSLVEFCPPQPWGRLALVRAYREPGSCPDGGTPLLKPVVASEGDLVTVGPEGIRVNGRLLPYTAPVPQDSQHRPLTHFTEGEYITRHGEIWVVSGYDHRSFDSRYFGPIQTSSIRNHVKPLLIWGPGPEATFSSNQVHHWPHSSLPRSGDPSYKGLPRSSISN